MEENKCTHLAPEMLPTLVDDDTLKLIYEKQCDFQEKLGRLALIRKASPRQMCDYLKDQIIQLISELMEILDRLPQKHWKKYPEWDKGWPSEELRNETLFEYIDALHFFMNIGVVLGFSPEEIRAFYLAKNKENIDRQNRGY